MHKTFLAILFTIFATLVVRAELVFRAGAATSNISPWMGLSINGNMHNHIGTNLHDQLHVRAIVLDDGTNRLAIAVADSCMIYREIFDNAKKIIHEKSGLGVENILMSATHTHSAPASVSIFQTDADKEYQMFLTRRLADAVLKAINNLQPAKIGWDVERDPRHVSNRRWHMKPGVINKDMFGGTNDQVRMNPRPGSPDLLEPAGPSDPDVSVVTIKSIDDKPFALLANYSMHYCGDVGGDGIYSADYFGAFCEAVQRRLDPQHTNGFVAILSNGTSGDCSSTDFEHAPTPAPAFTKINAVANDIADDALKCFSRAQYHEWVPLKVVTKEIVLGVRHGTPAEVVRAKVRLAKVTRHNGQVSPWSPDVYTRETVLLNEFPNQVPVILQAIRIGDLGIVAIPCEVFAEIGLEIKAKSPLKQTFTIELANAYHGYLPTPAQHKLGGYETWRARSSYLEVDASPKVVTAVIDLLQQLRH
ncbi:MAG: Neutral/alkaline non-lysosomal ceramidase [Verrucomicrobiales bacterium]|nr:Neutral/alkaline non-lysosomal ceramidase [Verrucomicrobiales bacterium]